MEWIIGLAGIILGAILIQITPKKYQLIVIIAILFVIAGVILFKFWGESHVQQQLLRQQLRNI